MPTTSCRCFAVGEYHPCALTRVAAQCLFTIFLCVNVSSAGAGEDSPIVRVAPPGVHHFPFLSSALNLAARDYAEKEYLYSGTAQAYVDAAPFGPDGRWSVKPNPGVTARYTTRMLVRRPSDPEKFNGTVLVEWFNESAGFDFSPEWGWMREELLREGYAYVGVTVQYVGALALQQWEAGQPGDRYAAVFNPGDSFAYDIFTQAARAIRRPGEDSARPLGKLTSRVRSIIATGHSQSASLLFTYANAVQPLVGAFDGFLLSGTGFGAPLSVNGGSAADPSIPTPPGVPATPFIDVAYPAGIRTDLRSPVLVEASEYDIVNLGVGASIHFQADSRDFRLWEVAGMAHFDKFANTFEDVSKTFPGFPDILAGCTAPPANTGKPAVYALRAGVNALNRWVRTRTPPVSAPRMTVDSPDPFQPAIIHRDPATNLALGGVRLPPIAVPIGTLTGERPPGALDTCTPLLGAYDPWNRDGDTWDGQVGFDPSPTPEPDLQLLYENHAHYVEQVEMSADRAVRQGFLRPADAAAAIHEAKAAKVP